MFGCWLGCFGAIAAFDEVAGISDDMLSALFLVGDCSCGDSSCELSSLGISGVMEASDMEE